MATTQDIAFSVLFSVVLVFNIAGNSLVIYIISNERGMKTSTNYLLFNLAIADLLFGVFLVPQYISLPFYHHLVPDGVLGDWLCKLLLNGNIAWMASTASLFTMVCLSVERYFAVCRPHTFSRRFSSRNVKILIVICWIYSFLTSLPEFVFSYRNDSHYENPCPINISYHKISSSYSIAEAAVSLIMMIYFLVKISLTLWCKQTVEPTGEREITERKKKKKVTHCVLAVVVTFILCWIPDYITYFLEIFVPAYNGTEHSVLSITALLMLINSALDPYLYSFQSSKFRIILKRVICRKENV